MALERSKGIHGRDGLQACPTFIDWDVDTLELEGEP